MTVDQRPAMDQLLDAVAWEPVESAQDDGDDLPCATHTGILRIGAVEIPVVQLSTGQRIIPADGLDALFAAFANDETSEPAAVLLCSRCTARPAVNGSSCCAECAGGFVPGRQR